jgi:transcriptional antiterminator NusG
MHEALSVEEPKFFALQLRTGLEEKFMDWMRRVDPGLNFHFPKKEMTIRRQGKQSKVLAPLFPGYAFLRSERLSFEQVRRFYHTGLFFRFLPGKSNQGYKHLEGRDLEFVMRFYKNGPVARISKVEFDENDRIVVVDGPLKGYEGCIFKVDKRKRRAWFKMDFCDQTLSFCLCYDVIAKAGHRPGLGARAGA